MYPSKPNLLPTLLELKDYVSHRVLVTIDTRMLDSAQVVQQVRSQKYGLQIEGQLFRIMEILIPPLDLFVTPIQIDSGRLIRYSLSDCRFDESPLEWAIKIPDQAIVDLKSELAVKNGTLKVTYNRQYRPMQPAVPSNRDMFGKRVQSIPPERTPRPQLPAPWAAGPELDDPPPKRRPKSLPKPKPPNDGPPLRRVKW